MSDYVESGWGFLNDSSGSSNDFSGSSNGSGNGNNQDDQNNQTGETGSSGHKLLDQYNQLVAEGKGGTTQAQNLGRYLGRVEQKKQAEGESLYDPGQSPLAPGQTRGPAGRALTTKEKVEDLAMMEAGQEKYKKSWEGQQFVKDYIKYADPSATEEDVYASKSWLYKFGMPSIVAMPEYASEYGKGTGDYLKNEQVFNPILTTEGGEYIYSGLGQALMDQYNQPGFDYGTAKDAYWDDRAVQESRPEEGSWYTGHQSGGGGGGGGGGYYGDPRTGNPIDRYGNFYTPQANLQQAMVNVHGTPTVFRKRGGIVSLLRLN